MSPIALPGCLSVAIAAMASHVSTGTAMGMGRQASAAPRARVPFSSAQRRLLASEGIVAVGPWSADDEVAPMPTFCAEGPPRELPWVMTGLLAARHLVVMHREHIRRWTHGPTLERALQAWLDEVFVGGPWPPGWQPFRSATVVYLGTSEGMHELELVLGTAPGVAGGSLSFRLKLEVG